MRCEGKLGYRIRVDHDPLSLVSIMIFSHRESQQALSDCECLTCRKGTRLTARMHIEDAMQSIHGCFLRRS